MTQRRTSQSGYNLVEVLVAMGLLASVLISIVTLFVMGRKNVYSGKQMTRAVSVATSVNEDLIPLNPARTWEAFGIDASDSVSDQLVHGVTYEDAILRSTDDLSDDVEGYLARWLDLIPQQRLADARVTLILQPRELVDSSDVTTARLIQIKIIVEWDEARRHRSVVLESAKLNRRA
ncbi:MAG: type IV pilus modification PilV family protein [Thermoanaerobaculia bacterium]